MENLSEKMVEVDQKIEFSRKRVEADTGASSVLNAVMQELDNKSKKSLSAFQGSDASAIRDHVVELEQAADSAKAAAEADQNIDDATRQTVLDAHTSICLVKADESSAG